MQSRPRYERATVLPRLSTLWNVQFVVVIFLWFLVGISPLPKGDIRWYAMLSVSSIVSVLQLAEHHFRRIDIDSWERRRAIYEASRAASEKLKTEVDENLQAVRREIADLGHRSLEWKREANRYARMSGTAVPFPSIEIEAKSVTKN